MRFHFSTYNHLEQFKGTLLDMFAWLEAGLRDLGHEVTFSDESLSPSALNVVWEGFSPESGEELRDSGMEYGSDRDRIHGRNRFQQGVAPIRPGRSPGRAVPQALARLSGGRQPGEVLLVDG